MYHDTSAPSAACCLLSRAISWHDASALQRATARPITMSPSFHFLLSCHANLLVLPLSSISYLLYHNLASYSALLSSMAAHLPSQHLFLPRDNLLLFNIITYYTSLPSHNLTSFRALLSFIASLSLPSPSSHPASTRLAFPSGSIQRKHSDTPPHCTPRRLSPAAHGMKAEQKQIFIAHSDQRARKERRKERRAFVLL